MKFQSKVNLNDEQLAYLIELDRHIVDNNLPRSSKLPELFNKKFPGLEMSYKMLHSRFLKHSANQNEKVSSIKNALTLTRLIKYKKQEKEPFKRRHDRSLSIESPTAAEVSRKKLMIN